MTGPDYRAIPASAKEKTFERYTVRGMAAGMSRWKICSECRATTQQKNETVGLFHLSRE